MPKRDYAILQLINLGLYEKTLFFLHNKIYKLNNIIDETIRIKLEEALGKHMLHPFSEIKQSEQATAPIFPWDASFTIDGINGFRYGDIVTFAVLPKRYRVNTVFSVIGVNHDLSQDGQWKTEIKCIMRPKIEPIVG